MTQAARDFPPGDLTAIIPFEVTFGGRLSSAPVEVAAGRHTVRVRIPRGIAIANGKTSELPGPAEPVLLVSNRIDVDVVRSR